MNLVQPAGHPNSDVAFSGLEQDYEAARPGYPAAALKVLQDLCSAPRRICDVGCGTGKLTRQLAEIYPTAEITGLDVNADMIDTAHKAGGARIRYAVSPAESLPVDNGSVDLVTAAQAVQWFDRPAFFVEAGRALDALGLLCLIENNRNWQRNAFLDGYEELLESTAPNYSRHYRNFDYLSELSEAGFDVVADRRVDWQRPMSPDAFRQMARSSTRYQAALRADASTPERLNDLMVDATRPDGVLPIDYETRVIIAVCSSGEGIRTHISATV